MISLRELRSSRHQIIVLGNHEPIIQSLLDFDYLSGKKASSVLAILTGRRGVAKYFFGRQEILLPTLASLQALPALVSSFPSSPGCHLWFLNLLSGRRTLFSLQELSSLSVKNLPLDLVGGAIFAENVPELHALEILRAATAKQQLVVGPASVGLLVPGVLKLGAIGGITPEQIKENQIMTPGHFAVLSASGGMTNELINLVNLAGHHLSFALSFGGDRFPVLSPREAFLLAEADPQTTAVLYYGELGGEDEYELVKLKEACLFTKKLLAHIAGTVTSLFPSAPQFGHAKAKADSTRTTALAKRKVLAAAGFDVSSSFADFIHLLANL